MRYYKIIEDGYVLSIGTGSGGSEITKEEYDNLLSVIRSAPIAESGYQYRLKADLTWELVELPPEPEYDPEATEVDYLEALAELGVTLDEEI